MKRLAVTLTDQGCGSVNLHAPAGEVAFTVTNKGHERGEFEVIAPGPHLVVDHHGIEPGKTTTVKANVTEGEHQLVCTAPGKARGKLTVTGGGGGLDPQVAAALRPVASGYHQYAVQEAQALLSGTQQFVAAVQAGDRTEAQSLYATTRVHYERLEPIAELFPDLDPAIDARADDFERKEQDPAWTGWHRLEYGLWEQQPVASLTPVANKLLSDTTALVTKIRALHVDPSVVANGAGGLIEEAAQTKVSGEEDRYSHTDIATLAANVEGAQKIVELLTPALQGSANGRRLLDLLADDFTTVTDLTNQLKDAREPSGYQAYDRVTPADREALKAGLANLSEDLATVPGVLGLRVS